MLKQRRALLACLAVGVTCVLWLRPFSWALSRGEPEARDFAPVIAGAHCLFHTCNPYDSQTVEDFFHQLTGHGVYIVPEVPVYPPSSFLAISPLLSLKWRPMYLTLTIAGAGLLLAAYILLTLKFDLFTSIVAYLPIVFAIQSGIMFPALWTGQPAVIAVASGAMGIILLISASTPVFATLLLGVSLALKPQLVLAPALYLVLRKPTRRYGVAALAIAAIFFVAGTALLYGQLHSFSFFARESANMKLALQPGHLSDPSNANPDSSGFLNLQVPLFRLIPNLRVDNLLTDIVALVFLLGLVYTYWREAAARERPYTIVAVLVLISLISVYHRHYDRLLILLLIPALWELRHLSRLFYWNLTALMFLWIFNQRLLSHLPLGAGTFPYTPLVEVVMCGVFLASLFHEGDTGDASHSFAAESAAPSALLT
jgi:Glycosyltransferase family 87